MGKYIMASFKIFTQSDILSLVTLRDGETKLGERVATYQATNLIPEILERSEAKFVVLGIPEDIGVRANFGIGGAQTAWKPALKSLLNLQENDFLSGANILVLGEFIIDNKKSADVKQLRSDVAALDEIVYPIIKMICEASKVPIVIGGGHNNAFPIIKGLSLARNSAVAAVNIDAHADLRDATEGRHSGNAFSTAISQTYLSDYRIFGLHESYLSKAQNNFINTNSVKCVYFEDLLRAESNASAAFRTALAGLKLPCGLEIDLDSISGLLTSAGSETGFTVNEVRQILLSNSLMFDYLHICEGAFELSDGRKDQTIGKTIAYIVADFIKNYNSSAS
jgi:formiminoglutamase